MSRGWKACPWRTASSSSPQAINHHPCPSASPLTRESNSLGLCLLSHHQFLSRLRAPILSQTQILTSKITQVCQDICDIKLRQLLVTCSDRKPDDITNHILTNQSDCKDTWGSNKSRPGTLGIHKDCAEDGTNYVYRIPNHHKHSNQDTLQHHDTYQPQWLPEPSGKTPVPLPYPDPSEASERPSWLQIPFCHHQRRTTSSLVLCQCIWKACQGYSPVLTEH